MNKQVILQALQSQLATVKAAAIEHEKTIYEPAVEALRSKIVNYFEEGVISGIHDIQLRSDRIDVIPNDSSDYHNQITLTYRCNWKGENAYVELDSYRPGMKSNEDNEQSLFYYQVTAAIASCFHNISKTYINKWQPAFNRLNEEKSLHYNEIYKIESEIRNCENEIATLEMEAYNQVGFECTLKPHANYETSHDNGHSVYTKTLTDHHIKAQYGRSKWDYAYINSFKVLSFPKSKFAKVVLEWTQTRDNQKRTVELNKARYAEFINDVYNWQSKGAEQREQEIDEKMIRWNKVEA